MVSLSVVSYSTGSTKARRYPLSYIYSGNYDYINGSLNNQGTYGTWWSATTHDSSNAYHMSMNNVVLNTQDNNNKIASRTLRKKPIPQRVNGWGIVELAGERFVALTGFTITNCHDQFFNGFSIAYRVSNVNMRHRL